MDAVRAGLVVIGGMALIVVGAAALTDGDAATAFLFAGVAAAAFTANWLCGVHQHHQQERWRDGREEVWKRRQEELL